MFDFFAKSARKPFEAPTPSGVNVVYVSCDNCAREFRTADLHLPRVVVCPTCKEPLGAWVARVPA